MKITFLFLAICLSFNSFSQTEEEAVKKIRAWYKETEAQLGSCIKVQLNDWESEEYYGGYSPEFTGYYDTIKKEFIKIDRYGAADWHEVWSSYYLKDGKLFFIFERGYSPGEMYTAEDLKMTEEEFWEAGPEAKTCNAFESRIYFSNEKVVRFLRKEQEVSVESKIAVGSDVKNVKQDIKEAYGPRELKYVYQIVENISKNL